MRARAILAASLLAAASRASAASPPGVPAASYVVEAGAGARGVRVEASFAAEPEGGLVFDEGWGRHARDVETAGAAGDAWAPASIDGDTLTAPGCRHPCRVRYRFLLDEAARASRSRSAAFAQEGALVAAPSVWLVRPAERGPGRYRLRVTTPSGLSFATGIFPAADGTYEADLADLPEAPYSAFGPFTTE